MTLWALVFGTICPSQIGSLKHLNCWFWSQFFYSSVWNLIIIYLKVLCHDIHFNHDIYCNLSVVVILYLITRARNASKRMNHDICPNSYIRYTGILWWYDSCIFVSEDVKLSFHHVIQFLVTRISSCGFKRKYTHTRLSILSNLI